MAPKIPSSTAAGGVSPRDSHLEAKEWPAVIAPALFRALSPRGRQAGVECRPLDLPAVAARLRNRGFFARAELFAWPGPGPACMQCSPA